MFRLLSPIFRESFCMIKYFAYGSNMDGNWMRGRGVKFLKREHAILKGWRLTFNKTASRNPREGYANIEKDEKSVVEGILYLINEEGLKRLDVYEGYPTHYTRIKVKVNVGDKKGEAIVYIAQPDKTREGLKPSKSYLRLLLGGCDLLSPKYCKKLKSWETLD